MTTPLRLGGLFAGYGGLDLAVASVLNTQPAWFSEYAKGPSKVLAHRFPGVPNHGDITKIDWSTVEPVDILTGGSPCQDLSQAGKRAGMTGGTRSNLWVSMREAIAQLQPSLVVWENVRGAYSASANSSLEHCPGCMGDPRHTGPALRALGRVLGDLSDLGYNAAWYGLSASDVGAPHGRPRVFVAAYPDSRGNRLQAIRDAVVGQDPTPPRNGDAGRHPHPLRSGDVPPHQDRPDRRGQVDPGWGDYARAVQHWESLTRPAPDASELGPTGRGRVTVAFSEWMMGLPAGWVTDVPGITYTEAREALGNGVVPQQAEFALRTLLADTTPPE